MYQLKPNANEIIGKLVYEDSVRAYYLSVCERLAKGYVQTFITDMQTLITKLGIIMSKVSTTPASISYCSQSISYLSNTVLKNPKFEIRFEKIGLNDKGNKGKHSIQNNNIDIKMCAEEFNNMVKAISSTYNLPNLLSLTLKPRGGTPKQSNPIKAQPKAQKSGKPAEIAANVDEKLTLKAKLAKGDGRYTKGLFNKKGMVNFLLYVDIINPKGLKITSVTAIFTCGSNTEKMKISTDNHSSTSIDLETSRFSGNIESTVIVEYKIGLFKSKTIKATVSKNF